MRIDDENKVVWCSEELFDWHSRKVSRATAYYAVADAVDTYVGCQEFKDTFSGSVQFELYLIAILNGYRFKLEQPKKHYWRKKKEYLAWFEGSREYLSTGLNGEPILDILLYSHTFTEKEAHDLLKDDFDKFEKVECE